MEHLYNTAYSHYTRTLNIVSFFTVHKTICCNSTPNAPDDGRMYPETRRAENTSIKLPCCIKLDISRYFTRKMHNQTTYKTTAPLFSREQPIRSFKMSWTTRPSTKCHIPEDPNPQMLVPLSYPLPWSLPENVSPRCETRLSQQWLTGLSSSWTRCRIVLWDVIPCPRQSSSWCCKWS